MKNKNVTSFETNIFTLGQLADYINGRAFKPEEWETQGLPIIRIQNLTKSSSHVNYYSKQYDQKHLITNGNLLLAWSATLDVFEWDSSDALLNQHIFKVEPNESVVLKRYYFYLIKNLIGKIRSQTHGSGMVHITKPKLLSLKVMIPSFEIQQEIVDKLDKQMAQIEIMKKDAERQKNAMNCCYKAYLQNIYSNMEKCQQKKIGDFFVTRYGLSKPSVNDPTKIPAVRMSNISYEGDLFLDELTYLDLSEAELNKHKLKKNDLLFNRTNSAELVGKTTVFDCDNTFVSVSYIVVATPKTNEINSKYVAFYLNNPEMKKYFTENCNRAISQANFSATKLSNIDIPIPNSNVQNEIVHKIENMKSKISDTKQIIDHQLNVINQLPVSILNEVFGKYELPDEV
ncbi:restriction endonuclease subunit S [Candidatus Babeliales bacterium]|nr:restriction endonuclease subunit S [Candidatus Babeliales bacterium]